MENKKSNKTGLIVIIALFAVLMIGGTVLYNTLLDTVPPVEAIPAATEAPAVTVAPQAKAAAKDKPAEVAGPMPRANLAKDFTAYTDDGQRVRLIEKRGKPVGARVLDHHLARR